MARFFCNTPEPGAYIAGVGFFHRGDIFNLDDASLVSRTFAPLDQEGVDLCKAAGWKVGVGEVPAFGPLPERKQVGVVKVASVDTAPTVAPVVEDEQTVTQLAGPTSKRQNDLKL